MAPKEPDKPAETPPDTATDKNVTPPSSPDLPPKITVKPNGLRVKILDPNAQNCNCGFAGQFPGDPSMDVDFKDGIAIVPGWAAPNFADNPRFAILGPVS